MKPATTLPWKVTGFRGLDGHAFGSDSCSVVGRTMQLSNGDSKQNAEYIAHAANAYPKLVEALRGALCVAYSFGLQATGTGEYQIADRLLRELGEAK